MDNENNNSPMIVEQTGISLKVVLAQITRLDYELINYCLFLRCGCQQCGSVSFTTINISLQKNRGQDVSHEMFTKL